MKAEREPASAGRQRCACLPRRLLTSLVGHRGRPRLGCVHSPSCRGRAACLGVAIILACRGRAGGV